jgi:CrcB protein
MIAAIMVFLGGGAGSMCRYILARHLNGNISSDMHFPWGTFAANTLSCLILGLLIEKLDRNPALEIYKWFFIAGFCGGFSTFSSFIWEWIVYARNNMYTEGVIYISLSFFAGIASMFTGMFLYKNYTG